MIQFNSTSKSISIQLFDSARAHDTSSDIQGGERERERERGERERHGGGAEEVSDDSYDSIESPTGIESSSI